MAIEQGYQFLRYYENLPEQNKSAKDTVFIGDIHGSEDKKDFWKNIENLTNNDSIKTIIFIGDIGGNKNLAELQRLFYNKLVNHSRLLLKENTDYSNLINHEINDPILGNFTLKEGFLSLKTKELELIGQKLDPLTDAEIIKGIKEYSNYFHFGHYVSNLPESVKLKLAKEIENNLGNIVNIIKKLEKTGKKVIMISGNWDEDLPIDFQANPKEAIILPPNERLISIPQYLNTRGVEMLTDFGNFETEKDCYLLAPYKVTRDLDTENSKWQEIKKITLNARKLGKKIILVTHGEPSWEPFKLNNPLSAPNKEHQLSIKGINKMVLEIEPDQLIHGHIHDDLTGPNNDKWTGDVEYIIRLESGQDVSIKYLKLRQIK